MVLMLTVAMAGCFDGGEDDDPAGPATGQVSGTVRDEAGLAVAGATVTILLTGLEQTTGDDGSFRFDAVPEGIVRIAISKPGYLTTTRTGTVPGGGSLTFGFTVNSVPQVQPFDETLPFDGTIGCGLPGGVSCGQAVDPNASTHHFDVQAGLEGMIVELVWTPPAAPAGQTLAIDVMAATPTACGTQYAQGSGGSPLRIEVTEGFPLSGGHQCVTVRPGDETPTIEQDYTLYVSLFYHAPPADGFTALA